MAEYQIPEHYEMERRLKEMTGKNVRFGSNMFDPKNFSLFTHLVYRDCATKKKILLEQAQDAWVKTKNIEDFYQNLKEQVLKAVEEIEAEERTETSEQKMNRFAQIEKIINESQTK